MRLTRITLILLGSIITIGFGLLTHYLLDDLESQSLQATEESMIDTAHFLAAMLEEQPDVDPAVILDPIFQLAKKRPVDAQVFIHRKLSFGLNAYVTDKDGIVIYDSGGLSKIGKNYAIYRDVARTLDGRYGARSSRMNEKDSESSIMYIGAAIRHEGDITGMISLYKAQADVLPFIVHRRKLITTSALLIALGIVLFTGAVFVWLWQPVGRLTDYARAISEGKRPALPPLGKGREVNTLGTALHDMREALEGRNYTETYVRTLTHELKSPLAAIRGAAELLEEDMPVEQRQRFLKNIQKESERSRKLIDGLLQLSTIEAKTFLEHSKSIDFTQLVTTVTSELKDRAATKGIIIHPQLSSASVLGDPQMLRLAIANLLENAIAFSSHGDSIQVSMETTDYITLKISDQGPGIPDYAQEKVFNRFYSLDRPNRPASKSTGLGLPFVRETATLHGGSISLHNNPEAPGALAILILPVSSAV